MRVRPLHEPWEPEAAQSAGSTSSDGSGYADSLLAELLVQVDLGLREPPSGSVKVQLRRGKRGAAVARVHREPVLDLATCCIRVFHDALEQARWRAELRKRDCAAAQRLDEPGG